MCWMTKSMKMAKCSRKRSAGAISAIHLDERGNADGNLQEAACRKWISLGSGRAQWLIRLPGPGLRLSLNLIAPRPYWWKCGCPPGFLDTSQPIKAHHPAVRLGCHQKRRQGREGVRPCSRGQRLFASIITVTPVSLAVTRATTSVPSLGRTGP